MATRMALLKSARHKEEREQIGALSTPVISELLRIEKKCLLRVSEAARASNNLQVALNSITRAQRLEQEPGPLVLEEFSQVLWLLKEPKLAIQSLRSLLSGERRHSGMDPVQEAILLSRLVSNNLVCALSPPDLLIDRAPGPRRQVSRSLPPSWKNSLILLLHCSPRRVYRKTAGNLPLMSFVNSRCLLSAST